MKMNAQNERITRLLQESGLRLTRQRCFLAGLLFDGTHKHMTAEQVHAVARKNRAPMALATVYNALHQFTAAGLLREVVIDRNRIYFDTNTDTHHHFFNETTGDLMDVDAKSVVVSRLPRPPAGSQMDRVDVVIRVRSN